MAKYWDFVWGRCLWPCGVVIFELLFRLHHASVILF
jgi:hypothetical protein